MAENKLDGPLKFGLLLVTLSWFLYTFYQFAKSALYGSTADFPFWLVLTDNAAIIGFGFRTAGSLMAVIAVLFYVCNRKLSKPEATMTLRWILVTEIVYWLSLFPSGIWGILPVPEDVVTAGLGFVFVIETGIPCLVDSLAVSLVLIKLFFELNPNKPSKGAIRWGLISATVFAFVFWLDNTSNWIAAIIQKGVDYILLYPINLLSFCLTSVGLLVLALYVAYFTRKSIGTETLTSLDLPKIGAILICLGLYFDIVYLLWLFFGSVGGWGLWYQWILGHNMNLWALSLPLMGLPLLFRRNPA
jgi:hypothetical protein